MLRSASELSASVQHLRGHTGDQLRWPAPLHVPDILAPNRKRPSDSSALGPLLSRRQLSPDVHADRPEWLLAVRHLQREHTLRDTGLPLGLHRVRQARLSADVALTYRRAGDACTRAEQH